MAMTNHTPLDHGTALTPDFAALAPVGGTRRPVKIVDLPVFRSARARLDAPFTVVCLPVVSLDRPDESSACLHRAAGLGLAITPQEAA
jgi:hypothetical protein